MSIEERLMKQGRWDLGLVAETPQSVRDVLVEFGHIFVTPARLPTALLSDTPVFAAARYGGILQHIERDSISGPGMAAWLDDEQGKSSLIFLTSTHLNETLESWVNLIAPNAVTVGTVTPTGGSAYRWRAYLQTAMPALNHVCAHFGVEWRISPTSTLDVGPASSLFETDPDVVVTRLGGEPDLTYETLRAIELENTRDVEDFTTDVYLLAEGEGTTATLGSATLGAHGYVDLFGHEVFRIRLVDGPSVALASANSWASLQLGQWDERREAVSLASDVYDIRRSVKPGDSIYVYDPQVELFDTGNQIVHNGRRIWPVKIRVLGCTWPVDPKMGVYYRSGAGAYTDLTEWVVPETEPTRLEVGEVRRTIGQRIHDRASRAAIVERVNR